MDKKPLVPWHVELGLLRRRMRPLADMPPAADTQSLPPSLPPLDLLSTLPKPVMSQALRRR